MERGGPGHKKKELQLKPTHADHRPHHGRCKQQPHDHRPNETRNDQPGVRPMNLNSQLPPAFIVVPEIPPGHQDEKGHEPPNVGGDTEQFGHD